MSNQLFEKENPATAGALREELEIKYPDGWPLAWFLFEPADIKDMADRIGVEVTGQEIEIILGIMNRNKKWFREMIFQAFKGQGPADLTKSPF